MTPTGACENVVVVVAILHLEICQRIRQKERICVEFILISREKRISHLAGTKEQIDERVYLCRSKAEAVRPSRASNKETQLLPTCTALFARAEAWFSNQNSRELVHRRALMSKPQLARGRSEVMLSQRALPNRD